MCAVKEQGNHAKIILIYSKGLRISNFKAISLKKNYQNKLALVECKVNFSLREVMPSSWARYFFLLSSCFESTLPKYFVLLLSITEWLRLEGTSGNFLLYPTCSEQSHLQQLAQHCLQSGF